MSRQLLARQLRELMGSVDSLLQVYDTDSIVDANAALQKRFDACNAAGVAVHQHWVQTEARARGAPHAARATAALDWIQPCVDAGVVPWLSRALKLTPPKAARVPDGAAPLGARRNAASSLVIVGPSAFMLLEHLLDQIFELMVYGDAQHKARAQQLLATLHGRDFMAPAAAAFRAWTLFTACLALPPTREALDAGGGYDAAGCLVQAAAAHSAGALAACKYSRIGCALLVNRMNACGLPAVHTAGAAAAAPVPAPVAELIDALASSRLVPVAAGMLLGAPLVDEALLPRAPGVPHPRDRLAVDVQAAAKEAGQALCALQSAHMRLVIVRGATSGPGVTELGRLLDSPDVTALRHALLERLAAHGGLAAAAAEGGGGAAEERAWRRRRG
ncbi:hypothetical protein GPECTOR_25g366 [Gonium pectorale]|uniref:Uncharacterized protein n=1 Tax=Gonium pectorale TaxID=33097 RepID=A0A150GG22_GONPE|nr:hypothetical protein GPECTOR_25g366 [Gonium pectorale]|eukprot:KXZ48782.1 hypothetical protein GPECTOR_25g366 [Gonium pectorale]